MFTRSDSRHTSTAVDQQSGRHLRRPRRLGMVRRFGLVALSALALAAGAGIGAENAVSATSNMTTGGGTCVYNQYGEVVIKTGTFQFSAQTKTLVKEWVRLVDVNGNPQTGWYYMGSAWAAPGSPASFGISYVKRSAWNTASRIQAYFAFEVSGVLQNDAFITTTWYNKMVASTFWGGVSYQASAPGSSCYH